MWNFFRVENEHVNNVGQFRAVRDLSLYPVDLSGQAEQEDDDFMDRRGSLERGEALSGKTKRKLTRKLSNALMEVGHEHLQISHSLTLSSYCTGSR